MCERKCLLEYKSRNISHYVSSTLIFPKSADCTLHTTHLHFWLFPPSVEIPHWGGGVKSGGGNTPISPLRRVMLTNHSQYPKYIMNKFCFEYFKLHISFVHLFIFDVGYWSSIFCVHFILLESLNLQNIRKQTPNSKAQQNACDDSWP